MQKTMEVNFDGLVGNTHNYAGLSLGNLASDAHKGRVSSPQAAALQGLEKMKWLHDHGYRQGVLPPQLRPHLGFLKSLGFSGSVADILQSAKQAQPLLFHAACSASSMWTANAATVAPSADNADKRVHFSPANLGAMQHRSIEAAQTAHALKTIFADPRYFVHHAPLFGPQLGDEGAANHTRFYAAHATQGVHLFVYGQAFSQASERPKRFPARQSYESVQALAKRHALPETAVVFAQQNPAVIDAGVFHHDVIGVGHGDVLFVHAQAFLDKQKTYADLQQAFDAHGLGALRVVEVPDEAVSVTDAVSSYLFNSQLLSKPNGKLRLLAPTESEQNPRVKAYLDNLQQQADSPIDEVVYINVSESMDNGGGPACLRLRVPLTEAEIAAISGRVLFDDALYQDLKQWVKQHYREKLAVTDLCDVALYEESVAALDALATLLELPNLYANER